MNYCDLAYNLIYIYVFKPFIYINYSFKVLAYPCVVSRVVRDCDDLEYAFGGADGVAAGGHFIHEELPEPDMDGANL